MTSIKRKYKFAIASVSVVFLSNVVKYTNIRNKKSFNIANGNQFPIAILSIKQHNAFACTCDLCINIYSLNHFRMMIERYVANGIIQIYNHIYCVKTAY